VAQRVNSVPAGHAVRPVPAKHRYAVRGLEDAESVYEARTPTEREAIYAFRHRIYVEELGRKLGRDAEGRPWVHDPDDEHPHTRHLYTVDETGAISGSLRARFWAPGTVPAKDFAAFSMERVAGIDGLATGELGRLMVAPGARGTHLLAALLSTAYELGAGELGADLVFINCAPPLVRLYRKLGCRTYAGRLVPTPDGSEVPMLLVMSDLESMERADSFLLPLARRHFGAGVRAVLDLARFGPLFASSPIEDDPAIVAAAVVDRVGADSVLSPFGPDTLGKLAAQGMLLSLGEGELLTEKGLGQRELFVVVEGVFEAVDGDRRLRLLTVGDLIGEVAYFSTNGRRTASVRAVTHGRVLVLRASAIKRLRRSDPEAAAEVVTHFARVLADRMTAT
jgi:predicted GNAT family N-acyltransferase